MKAHQRTGNWTAGHVCKSQTPHLCFSICFKQNLSVSGAGGAEWRRSHGKDQLLFGGTTSCASVSVAVSSAEANRGDPPTVLMGLFTRLSHVAGPPGNDAVSAGSSRLGLLFNHESWLPLRLLPPL